MNNSSSGVQLPVTGGRYHWLVRPAVLLAPVLVVFLCTPQAATAANEVSADSIRMDTARVAASPPQRGSRCAGPCNPTAAFLFALPLPGGGQFYLGDVAGGVEAVATDLLLVGALISGGASLGGIVSFVATAHVIEGLFAAQECRRRTAAAQWQGDPPPAGR